MSGVGLGAGMWIGLNPLINGQITRGVFSMPSGAASFSVTGLSLGTTSYAILAIVSNVVDPTPRHLNIVVTAKSTTGFNFITDQTTDSANYKAEYVIIKL